MSQTTTTRTHDDHLIIAADALRTIALAVGKSVAAGAVSDFQIQRAAEKSIEGITEAELVSCWHVFHHQEAVEGKANMRDLRFAMSHEHYRRVRIALALKTSEEILDAWAADPVPFSIGPGMLERNHQEACASVLEDRLGDPIWEALDTFLDEWTAEKGERADDEDEQSREARNAEFRTREIEVYRRVLAAQS